MAIETLGAALRQINRLFAEGVVAGLSDAQLLERFLTQADAGAFEALVGRHGPMVLSVCRGMLRDPRDAEDAFQATFLVLVKKGSTIRGPETLGGWLYQVAHRVAIQANAAAARRRTHERQAGQLAVATSTNEPPGLDDLLPVLHEEIARLPARERLALVLCDLEGMTQPQAAAQLHWSERTLRNRLAEGRARLKVRLARRGLAPDGATLGALFVREARLAVPTAWYDSTVSAALATVNHTVAAGAVSATVHTLTREVLEMIWSQNLRWALAALLAVGAGGFAVATLALDSNPEPRPREQPPRGVASKPEPKMELARTTEEDRKPVPIAGRVLDPDGKPLPGATIYVQHNRLQNVIDEILPKEPVAQAGADGRFHFDLDPAKSDSPIGDVPSWQSAVIAAVAPGYGPAWVEAGDAARIGADLRMVRDDLPIRGRILDSQGRPVASATVLVQWLAVTRDGVDLNALLASSKLDWDGDTVPTIRRPFWSSPTWIGRNECVTTDAEGRFELSGMGRDRVAVLRINRQGLEKAYIAVLDRVPRGTGRPPWQLSPTFNSLYGETGLTLYGTTFDHVLGPSKPITGLVRDKATGQPVAGVTVAGQVPGRMWAVVMTKTDGQGHFRIDGLPKASSYKVDIRPEPGSPYLPSHPPTVTDTEGLKPIDLTLELRRGVAVVGRLIDRTSGRAVSCDWFHYWPLPSNPDQQAHQNARSSADHSFRMTVPHGAGMIAVKARGKSPPYPGTRLAPADKGKLDVFDLFIYHAYRIVDYPEGTDSATLDLEVTPGITRKVELVGPNGQPVTRASAMGLTTSPFDSATIEGASFEVYGLRPDESRLIEIRHEGLGLGGSITVSGSDPADRPLVVRLAPYGAIAGRVLDEDGLPLHEAKVSATVVQRRGFGPSDPNFRPREAVSDAEGRFRIDGINPTLSVLLWFHKPGAPPYGHEPKTDKDLSNVTPRSGEILNLGDIVVGFKAVQ